MGAYTLPTAALGDRLSGRPLGSDSRKGGSNPSLPTVEVAGSIPALICSQVKVA